MALFSTSLNQVIICVFILCGVQPSLQDFCPTSFLFTSIDEGPDTKGLVLFVANLTELSLSSDDNGYLAVNETLGNGFKTFTLYIAKEVDYEERTGIVGRIICGDSSATAEYEVWVHFTGVNEFMPEFDGQPPYNASIPEDAPEGASVFALSASDKDRPITLLIYSIVTNTSLFAISGSTVRLNGALDYDGGPTSYILNISVMEQQSGDTSYTTLTINITDVDDVGPRFSSNATYTLSVPEGTYGASSASFVTDPPLSAKDGDSLNDTVKIDLDQTSSSLADRFRVEENGSIQLTGTLAPGQYTINVRAYQTNRPVDRFAIASVLVTVYDVNDNSPIMSSPTYSGSVLEGAVPDTVVLTVSASDSDQGDNSSFAFRLNDSSVPFNITTDRTVGIIRVTGVIDRETTQSYTLHVFAKEDKTPESRESNVSVVTITVLDANDNSPEFQGAPYTFQVNETDAVNYVVGHVNATDHDEGANGNVTYSISRRVGVVSAFRVDQSTGVITLSRGLRQNDTGTVLIDVRAEDNPVGGQSKRSASTQVTVTILPVNADRPAFSRSSYAFTVKETVPTNFSLGEISATNNDGDQLLYTLEGDSRAFRLEGNPPRLLVNTSLDLDNGQLNRYAFQVAVTDRLHRDTANVTVSVTTVNEHSPVLQSQYRADVWENATFGMLVVKITATDDDAGEDGQVSFTMTTRNNGPFVLDSSSGDLTLNCSGCLDVSASGSYILVVKAEDGGNPAQFSYTTVIITVKDVNNKAPKFASDVITGSVLENAGNGTTVLWLQARDEDTDTSLLTYRLQNVTPAGWLAVTSSYVVTKGTLDAETSRFITATVKVSDGVQEGSASLNVTILDVNDNFPQPRTSDSGTNIGLIVGPLVAILLIGALAGVVGNVLWQRKRKRMVAPEEEEEGAGKEPSNVVDEKKEEPKPQPPAQENQEATPVPATTVDF